MRWLSSATEVLGALKVIILDFAGACYAMIELTLAWQKIDVSA
ncbi:MAG: hypothetical protein WCD18_10975 [Thermosynechococcaceae cyanobacterium]